MTSLEMYLVLGNMRGCLFLFSSSLACMK
jgi:hypothetical protein